MPVPTARHALPKIDTNEFMNEENLHDLWDAIDAAIPLPTESVRYVAQGAFTGSTGGAGAAIPEGVTFKEVLAAEAGWPAAIDGVVMTHRYPGLNTRTWQMFFETNAATARVWTRAWNNGGSTWTAWKLSATDDQLASYQLLSQRGIANGYASLGADGKVPSAQLPSSSPAFPLSKDDAAAVGDDILRSKLAADAQYRFLIQADGGYWLGTGAAALQEVFRRRAGTSQIEFPGYVWFGSHVDIPSGAVQSQYQYLYGSSNGGALTNYPLVDAGVNTPEGNVIAQPGSLYHRRTATPEGEIWYKATGTGNTGWKLLTNQQATQKTADENCPNGLTSLNQLFVTLLANQVALVEVSLELENNSGSSLTFQPGLDGEAGSDTIRWSGESFRSDLNSNMFWVGQTLWGYSGSTQQLTTGTKTRFHLWGVIACGATSSRIIYPVIQNSNVGNIVCKAKSYMRAVVI